MGVEKGGGGVSVIVGCGILNSIVSPHRETLITILNLAQFMLGYLSLSNSELRPVFLKRRSQKGVSITKCNFRIGFKPIKLVLSEIF